MEDVWIMDSGCSRHMTGHRKWFSGLNPVSTKEYITFEDNGQGKALGVGSVSLSAKHSVREVAFVRNLGFNLVSVSQLLDEGFEVRFKKGACRVLDVEETLVCSLLPLCQVFRVDLTSISGPTRCLVASPSANIWKWPRRLGHLSFDLLVRLSSIGLIRGLPKLKAKKDLLCHPCHHGKIVVASHTPVSQVMTSYLGELLHMDTVGPARVASVSGKWYVLVVVDDFSRFSWVFSWSLRMRRLVLFGIWQPSVMHLRALGCRCFVLKKVGHLDKFESRCLDEIFLGYDSSSRAFRVWILEAKQVVETCEVSFDETMPYTTPAFELSGDDEEGTPIFEDEEGADDVGDAGATAPAAAPAPSATSSDDEGGPLPIASSSLPRQQAQAEASPAEDAGEVTSEIVPSRQVQQDHPPHRIIGDLHQRVTCSSVNSLAFFSHSAFVASFEPRDVSHALSDPNWVNAMHEDLENFERNHVWDLVEPPPNCHPIGTKWVFKNKQGENGMVIKQGPEGTFVHQAKYTRDMLKKFEMGDSKPMTTPMSTNTAIDADEDGEAVDQKEFRGMIGSLLYLTETRPDIQFAVCLCACYQASPRTSYRQAVKRIFRLQDEGVDNALIKGEIESQWIGLIALLV
ncbi:hypothetical protein U9M48_019343 [Paspalum notatum var. saurae]|uniref:Uncharacterized protein n=1 Tax=Paspalum notatum var. saurae TaxID=547442 RepID=A0AAQ3TDS6_PASNO